MVEHLHAVIEYLIAIPAVEPEAPTGAGRVLEVVSNAKWGAGVALLLGFFAGLVVWAGGRWVDHHRAGRIGVVMMLCAVAGGLLYAIGPQIIRHFAGVS